jgi:NADH-quinone oxidoreductase subunit A
MIESYIPIFMILARPWYSVSLSVNLSWLLGPQRPYREKMTTYESGIDPLTTAHTRFSIKYYMVALSFIIFDIEVVFMYPWAVRFKELGWPGFVVITVFVLVLVVGFIYELKKGALRWD